MNRELKKQALKYNTIIQEKTEDFCFKQYF